MVYLSLPSREAVYQFSRHTTHSRRNSTRGNAVQCMMECSAGRVSGWCATPHTSARVWRETQRQRRSLLRMGRTCEARGPNGHERSRLVKTKIAASIPHQLSASAEISEVTHTLRRREEEEPSEEAFEATILKLDDTTAERLFRKAGE